MPIPVIPTYIILYYFRPLPMLYIKGKIGNSCIVLYTMIEHFEKMNKYVLKLLAL